MKRENIEKKFNILKSLKYGAIGFIPITFLLLKGVVDLPKAKTQGLLAVIKLLNAITIYINYITQSILAGSERQNTKILLYHVAFQILLLILFN